MASNPFFFKQFKNAFDRLERFDNAQILLFFHSDNSLADTFYCLLINRQIVLDCLLFKLYFHFILNSLINKQHYVQEGGT